MAELRDIGADALVTAKRVEKKNRRAAAQHRALAARVAELAKLLDRSMAGMPFGVPSAF